MTKTEKRKELFRKFDNMTTYEIDMWLKDNGLYEYYGDYSRDTKIEKIIDRKMYYD